MPSISLKPGMIVLHPWHPRWGPGKVVSVEGPIAYIYFRDNLAQKAVKVHTQRTQLRVPQMQEDPILDRLPRPARVGADWVLPADYRTQMTRTQVNELENSLRRAVQQSHMGRLAFTDAETAITRLKLLWKDDENSRDAYDLAPPGLAKEEDDDEGWIDIAPVETAGPSRKWWMTFTDEFATSFRKMHRALHKPVFNAIRAIARDPEPGDALLARPLPVEVENLWCWRLGDYRVLYRPFHDQRLIVLMTLGKRTSRYD